MRVAVPFFSTNRATEGIVNGAWDAPPVGLNLYVISAIAPDVGLPTILAGAAPFALLMMVSILLLCVFPQSATWLPDLLMGSGT